MSTNRIYKLLVIAFMTLTCAVSNAKGLNNLVYDSKIENGIKVSETVYKNDGQTLTQFMKYNYKYDENKQMTENLSQKWDAVHNKWINDLCIKYRYEGKSVTTEYYKWNSKKNEFILVPEMTVVMDK